jgi:hypothetical protein
VRRLQAFMALFFFIFYGVGIPAVLLSMLFTAKINGTMGAPMTKEKIGWIYIRYTCVETFWGHGGGDGGGTPPSFSFLFF